MELLNCGASRYVRGALTPLSRTFEVPGPLDFGGTLGAARMGKFDPTCRLDGDTFARATYADGAPVTLVLRQDKALGTVHAEAFGPGAEAALELVPDHLGFFDDPSAFVPTHPPALVKRARQNPGLRMIKLPNVFHDLVHVILQQRVAWRDACMSYRRLVADHGAPAPGAHDLMVPPSAKILARLPSYTFRALQVEAKRAETIRRAAVSARRVEETRGMTFADAKARLEAFQGIGPWTSGLVLNTALGDPNAVPVGDLKLPHHVTFKLAGERRGSDERMLELLEPYQPHRWRAVRLLS